MAAPARPLPARRAEKAPPPRARRRFEDNPGLILASILLLAAVLVAAVAFAGRSTELYPDFMSEVVLYALTLADLTILIVLLFLLGRNAVKLVVERRRGLPFARFRSKLVAVLLAMTIIPSVLVLIVGSELLRTSVDRWFSAPIDQVLASAKEIAGDYYEERRQRVSGQAARAAAAIPADRLAAGDVEAVRRTIAPEVQQQRVGMLEVYRVVAGPGGRPAPEPVVAVERPKRESAEAPGETPPADEPPSLAAIERLDARLPVILERAAADVIAVTGDHATPASLAAHSWHPVPLLVHAARAGRDEVERFGERWCRSGALGLRPSLTLLPQLMAAAGRLRKYGA